MLNCLTLFRCLQRSARIGNIHIPFHFSGYNLLLPKDLTHKNMEVRHDYERSDNPVQILSSVEP